MPQKSKGVAWYDVKGKGWLRDLWMILHPPYTLWHLSYVPIGAALAVINWPLLGWTVLAFFLGMGVAGHCLDELNGRPLKTTIPTKVLWLLTAMGLGGALAIGLTIGVQETSWVIPCILFGGFIVFAYNLEWPRADWKALPTYLSVLWVEPGFFHKDIWFGVAWGAFPVLTAYVAQTGTLSWSAVGVSLFALFYSMAQRKLSLHSRFWRRKVSSVTGIYTIKGVDLPILEQSISKDTLLGPVDLSLKYMNAAIVAVAIALLLIHV